MSRSAFLRWLLGPEPTPGAENADAEPVVLATRRMTLASSDRVASVGVVRRSRYEVRTDSVPYWESMGWTHDGTEYFGLYRAGSRRIPGCITEPHPGTFNFYIRLDSPWPALMRHPHWPCFRPRGDNWYFVHFQKVALSPDAGILAIEATLGACRQEDTP